MVEGSEKVWLSSTCGIWIGGRTVYPLAPPDTPRAGCDTVLSDLWPQSAALKRIWEEKRTIMNRTLVSALPNALGKSVTVAGWVETVRQLKRMQFVVLRDHTGMVQAAHQRLEGNDLIGETLSSLTAESTINITGQVVANDQVKLGGLEIVIERIELVSAAGSPLPLNQLAHQDARLDWRFLDLRRQENYLIFRVQTTAEHAMRIFWQENGFLEIHSPKFMGSASESGAELFRVEYFDRFAYLAQSPQFYKQIT